MAKETYLEKCNFRHFKNFRSSMILTLTLDGSRSYQYAHTYRTTSTPDRMTLASSNTEIWPFKIRAISTFRKVWSYVIAFKEGNSKIRLRQAVDSWSTISFELHAGGDRPRKVQFSELQKLSDLDLDLGSGLSHNTGVHIQSRSTYTPN